MTLTSGRPDSPKKLGITPVAEAEGSGEFTLLSSDIPVPEASIQSQLNANRKSQSPEQPGILSILTAADEKRVTPRTQSLRSLRNQDEKIKNHEISNLIDNPLIEEGSQSTINNGVTRSTANLMGSLVNMYGGSPTYGSPTNSQPQSQRSSLSNQGAGGGSMGSLVNFASRSQGRKRLAEGMGIPMGKTSLEDLKNLRKSFVTPAENLGLDDETALNSLTNDFTVICDELASNYSSFQNALIQMMAWKDDFLAHSASPISMKLSLVLLLSQLFRSKSDLQEPIFTLIKQIKMFSQPWHDKRFAIVKLEADYQRLITALDVSIRKLELMKCEKDRHKSNIAIMRWDKICRKLMVKNYSKFFSKWLLITQIQTRKLKDRPKDTMPKLGEEDPILVDDTARRRRELSDDEDDENLKKFIAKSKKSAETKKIKKPEGAPPTGGIGTFSAFQDKKVAAFERFMYNEGLEIRSHLDQIEGINRDSVHHKKQVPYLSETSIRFSKISEISRQEKIEKFVEREAALAAANAIYKPKKPLKSQGGGRKKESVLGKAPKIPIKKSFTMIEFPLFNVEAETSMVKRSMIRSNSSNAIFDLKDLDWTKPFGEDNFDVDDIFLFDKYGDELELKNTNPIEDIELDKPPDYLKFDKIIKETENSFLGTLDPENTWFSLQDVLELTILHAQQVQVLHNSFTEQINDLGDQVDFLREQNRRMQESIKSPPILTDASTLTDPVELRQPKQSKNGSPTPPRAKSRMNPANCVEAGVQTNLLMSDIEDKGEARRKMFMRRETTARFGMEARRKAAEKEAQKHRLDDFAFAKTFLARLERFTQEKMKRQEIRVKTLKEKEQEQLQKTTVHTDPSTSHPVKSEMPAEFMPTLMPASPKARPLSHRKYQAKEDPDPFMVVQDQKHDHTDDDLIRSHEENQSSDYSSEEEWNEDGDEDDD